MLRHLATGPATVAELRTFALTETVYRAADANRVVQSLITTGAVRREPEHGRLGGDVLISA
jgi:predicted transcriptional regulator